MSPSEFDLRSALHDGDDEPLDVDRIVAGGRARAAARRTNLVTAVVAAACVGLAATTGIVIANHDDVGTATSADGVAGGAKLNPAAPQYGAKSAARDAVASNPSPSSASSTGNGGVEPRAENSPGPVACPTVLPRLTHPARPTPAPLFAGPSQSIVVCAYGTSLEARVGGGRPGRSILTGRDAQHLESSLEAASRTPVAIPCPIIAMNSRREFAFLPVDSLGRTQAPITATLSAAPCNVTVTNGTAVRYDWTPPAALLTRLLALNPAAPPTGAAPHPSPSGRNYGSPVR
ncbi:MAG: hypothetical protein ABI345_13335 [Jatrophihabitans sp.]